MWIPVFTETTEPDTLGKQRQKRVSCRKKKPKFASLQSPEMLGNSDLIRKDFFFGKLYSSRRTSAFGNPLVQDIRVLGSLSTRVFETRMATGSELFSLLTCLLTTTFILQSIFSHLEMISIKIWETPLF